MRPHRLSCHPSILCPWVHTLDVTVQRTGALLSLTYVLRGELARLRIPSEAATRAELWRHTCFEAFVRPMEAESYLEFNFAPSGAWAAYRFARYRTSMSHATLPTPAVTCSNTATQLELAASVDLPGLAAGLRIAIAAVIEDERGELSYWALAHPLERPDFHHENGFVLIR